MYLCLSILICFSFLLSVQTSSKVHPGSVTSIQLSPTNLNKLLIGYDKGVIVLWDVTQPLPERNFPSSIDDCKQVYPLVCLFVNC